MRIIGLSGRAGSGKDTAVEFIRQASAPCVVERRAFADKLKLSAARSLGYDVTDADVAVEICNRLKTAPIVIHDPVVGEIWLDGREFLQKYGTEGHRDVFGFDFWVDALLQTWPRVHGSGFPGEHVPEPGFWAEDVLPPPPYGDVAFPGVDVLCVTDVRFENEASRIFALGGQVWKIDADKRLGPLPENAHASEHGLPEHLITLTIPNNGTVEQFEAAIESAWRLTSAQ